MKGTLGARVAVSMAAVLLAAAARADTVVLNDGREIHGKASVEGAKVVVRTDYGETSFPRDEVAKVKSDEEVKREEEAEKKKRDEEKAADEKLRNESLARTAEDLLAAFGGKKKFEKLPDSAAIHWEKDGAEATRLASEAKKIVLTFSVLGELGTGHC